MELGLPPKPSRESLVAMCRDEPERAADLILMRMVAVRVRDKRALKPIWALPTSSPS